MLNIHHLELFYYVARFGGVTQAVRKMPYGITQSALSRQMIDLEEQVGVTLCPQAKLFCRKLQDRRFNAPHHIQKIVALSEIYGPDKVARALEDALTFEAIGCEYVAKHSDAAPTRERPCRSPSSNPPPTWTSTTANNNAHPTMKTHSTNSSTVLLDQLDESPSGSRLVIVIKAGQATAVRSALSHQLIDRINAAQDRQIAARLRSKRGPLDLARRNLRRWMARDGRQVRPVLQEWHRILTRLSRAEIVDFLLSGTPMARRLRQSSPFAGVLSDAERQVIRQRHAKT